MLGTSNSEFFASSFSMAQNNIGSSPPMIWREAGEILKESPQLQLRKSIINAWRRSGVPHSRKWFKELRRNSGDFTIWAWVNKKSKTVESGHVLM